MGLVISQHVISSWIRNWTCVPALAGRFLTSRSLGKSFLFYFKNVCAYIGPTRIIQDNLPIFISMSSLTLVIFCFYFDNCHFNGYEVISHCFNLNFPDNQWWWASFHVSVAHVCFLFWKTVYLDFLPICNVLFSWRQVVLQFCIGFWCTTMQISHNCTHIPSL